MEITFNNLNDVIIAMERLDAISHLITDNEYLIASNTLMRHYSNISELLRIVREDNNYDINNDNNNNYINNNYINY